MFHACLCYFLKIVKLHIMICRTKYNYIKYFCMCKYIYIDTFIGHVKFLNKELLCNGHGNIMVESHFEISCHF